MQEANSASATARTEYQAKFPKRVDAMRQAVGELREHPESASHLESLLSHLRAAAFGAHTARFTEVSRRLRQAEQAIAEATAGGRVDGPLLERIASFLDELPTAVRQAADDVAADDAIPSPGCFVVYGPATLCVALVADSRHAQVEVTDDPAVAREFVFAKDPDAVIIDADLPRAADLVETILASGGVASAPLIVVGNFPNPDQAARFAALGAARVMTKPVSPDQLRRTVAALLAEQRRGHFVSEPLGDVTVAALAERVAAEVRRGLAEAVEPGSDRVTIPLGEGTDVLAAVWSSVARIRELATMRSGGYVRFRNHGPEGAVPIAPWAGGDRRAGSQPTRRERTASVSLKGRRVVVADDDPAVVWFMTDLLRQAGVEVLEAHDGEQALDRARRNWPDLIISDVLMPKLDGFSLCREVHRDPGIHDVPVILLSWKEDLLQRARELGASADGFLRKEATASVVLERVQEVLRPRARVEARLDAGGDVRGRLDGISPRLVLDLVCQRWQDARVSFRDAVYLFEVEVRGGQLRAVTRTATDGRFDRGARALGALLGVKAGRFAVTPDASSCRADFSGTLFEVLAPVLAGQRRVLRALTAEMLPLVERVAIDEGALAGYLETSPPTVAKILREVLAGAAPRTLLQPPSVSLRTIETVLADAACHGAVDAVTGVGGVDLVEVANAPRASSDRPIPALELPTPAPTFSFELSPAPSEAVPALGLDAGVVEPLVLPGPAEQLESVRAMPAVETAEEPPLQGVNGDVEEALPVDGGAARPEVVTGNAGAVAHHAPGAPAAESSAECVDTGPSPGADPPPLAEWPEPMAESWAASREVAVGEPQALEEQRAAAEPEAPEEQTAAAEPAPGEQTAAAEPALGPASERLANTGAVVEPAGADADAGPGDEPAVAAAEVPSAPAARVAPQPLLPSVKRIAFPTAAALEAAEPPIVPTLPEAKKIVFPARAPAGAACGDFEQPSAVPSPSAPSPLAPVGEGPEVRASSPAPPVLPRAKKIAFPFRELRASEAVGEASEPETSAAPSSESTPDPVTPEPSVATPRDVAPGRFGWSPVLSRQLANIARVGGITAGTALVSFFLVRNVVPAGSPTDAPGVAASVIASATPALTAGTTATTTPPPPTPAATPTPQSGAAAAGLPDGKIEELATPPGFALDADRGLLEVVTPDRESIHIDGEWMGRGPLRRYPIQAGKHQVEIRRDGQQRSFDLTVTAGRRTRLSLGGS